jgi:hypothetical protein
MTSWRNRIVAAACGAACGAACAAACAVACAVAVPISPVSAQAAANVPSRPLGRLLGVFDDATSLPMEGAEVINLSTGAKALTSVSGAVSLARLESGVTVLQIRKVGYASQLQTVVVSPADTTSITIALKPLAQTLPEVRTSAANTTTGKLAMFEQHRAEGFGHFLTADELEKSQGRLTSDVFRTIPGMRLWPDPKRGSAWYVASNRGSGSVSTRPCLSTVMVDGSIVSGPFDINSVRPEELAGVEFYAGGATTPMAYGGTKNGCGTVVIWTR